MSKKVKYEYEHFYNSAIQITKYNGNEPHVKIPSEIDGHKVERIAAFAFDGHKEIKSIIIPEGVASIGTMAFNACLSLEYISIPKSMCVFMGSAFRQCYELKTVEYKGTKSDWNEILFCNELSNPMSHANKLKINSNIENFVNSLADNDENIK